MFSGAMTAIVTPFREGIDGLVPVGTTGESPTLDFDEHERVIAITVEAARKRVPVIAGTGGNATSEALELHGFAKRAGADACLSVNPYYNKPSQEGLYRHFMTLADRVDLPIVLYNIPSRTGITMSPQTVARLSAHKNIVAIKEATGSMDMASEIAALCDITILSGDDSLTVPLMSLGAKGVISVASNLLPAQIKAITKNCLAGNFAEAAKLHLKLFPFIRSLFLDGNPAGIKHAMMLAGMDSGQLRLPLWEANEGTKMIIEKVMREIGAPFAA
jgi:4-hydroxy-tetrahydrodipicolinate synthase